MNSKSLVTIGASAFAIAIGSLVGTMLISKPAQAASATTTTVDSAVASTTPTTTTSTAPPDRQIDPSKGGHTANGITETILTGDSATKATAAALAAVPGGTIQRVETDADGATYEAHVKKSDGTQVTVLMDASYNVTSTENGMGGPKK